MNKILLLIVLVFTYSWETHAQVTKDSFEKAVDYVNCKAIELTLSSKVLSAFKSECPCGNTSYDKIVAFLTKNGNLNKSISLSKEINDLKKNSNQFESKQDAQNFLADEIFEDPNRYKEIGEFAARRKGSSALSDLRQSILDDLTNILVEETKPANPVVTASEEQENALDQRLKKLEQEDQKFNGSFLGSVRDLLIILSIIIGLLTLALLLRRKSNNNYEEIINRLLKSNRLQSHIQNSISLRPATPNPTSRSSELSDAFKRINDLEQQVKNLKDRLSEASSSQPVIHQNYTEAKPTESRAESFFLSNPNSDGSFNESSASSSYKEGASIYRFTKLAQNRANFQIDEKSTSVKLALQYPDKNIDPACDALNAFNAKAQKIATVDPGEAELKNGKWVVIKKASIKYEN